MNFALNDEQVSLERSLEGYLSDRYTRSSAVSGSHWAAFAALGWLGAALPEDVGGSSGGPVETMVVMQAFGRHAVVEPYLATAVLGAEILRLADDPELGVPWLSGIADGSRQLAVGYAEPQARFEVHDIATTAVRHADEWRLDGRKLMVLNAPDADAIIVSARTSGGRQDRAGIGLFLIPCDAPGLELRSYVTQDGFAAADLTLSDVRLPLTARLISAAGEALEAVIDAASVALCAMAVGCMAACVEATGAYLKLRRQFGRPLASFQALQHRMVDMQIALEESRSLMFAATIALASGHEVRKAVSAAKITVGEAARKIGEEAVQMHGGIGITDEYAIGRFYKRLLTCATLFGDVEYHVGRYASELALMGDA